MVVNRDEAERCRDMGAVALRQGNYARAIKLLNKSLQLFPLPGVEALLEQAKRQQQTNGSSASAPGSASASAQASSSSGSYNPNQEPSTASTASTPSSPPQRSASTASSTATGPDGRSYTEEQVKVVQKILRAKEGGRGAHYRVLGLTEACTEAEIKKAYRKISLKVHPDKNAAPHADEAFKAVGLAYATLSDSQKRTIYDRYGEEDPDSRGGGGGAGGGMRRHGGGVHMNGQHVDPDEIFNMFFGGGMPMGGGGFGPGMHFYSNGFGPGMHFRAGGPRARPRAAPGGQQHPDQEPARNAGMNLFLQLLPILFMMLLSFSSYGNNDASASMPGVDRYFSLTQNTPFNHAMHTKLSKVKDIPYYVSDRFMRTYARDRYQLGQVERMVERAYEQYLFEECGKQTDYKVALERKARQERDEAIRDIKTKKAAEFALTRCTELDDLFPERRRKPNNKRNHRNF